MREMLLEYGEQIIALSGVLTVIGVVFFLCKYDSGTLYCFMQVIGEAFM